MHDDGIDSKWLSPPERFLAERAVERYTRGQLPAFDKVVQQGGLDSIPYLVCAQASIFVAGVLLITGIVISAVTNASSTANTVSNVALVLGGLFLLVGVFRIAQGVSVRNRNRRTS